MPLATQTPPSIWPDFRLSVARLYLSLAFAFRCLSIVVVERREVATQIKIVIPIIEMFFYHLIVKGSSNIFIKERGDPLQKKENCILLNILKRRQGIFHFQLLYIKEISSLRGVVLKWLEMIGFKV